MTPEAQLLYAAWCGDAARVGELLSVGVAVDVRDGKGRTPLMLAAGNNAVEAIRPLLAAGADPSARNNGNRPVIDYVCSVEVARLVLAHMPPEQRGCDAALVFQPMESGIAAVCPGFRGAGQCP